MATGVISGGAQIHLKTSDLFNTSHMQRRIPGEPGGLLGLIPPWIRKISGLQEVFRSKTGAEAPVGF